jgi:hypothetical protein
MKGNYSEMLTRRVPVFVLGSSMKEQFWDGVEIWNFFPYPPLPSILSGLSLVTFIERRNELANTQECAGLG